MYNVLHLDSRALITGCPVHTPAWDHFLLLALWYTRHAPPVHAIPTFAFSWDVQLLLALRLVANLRANTIALRRRSRPLPFSVIQGSSPNSAFSSVLATRTRSRIAMVIAV